MEGELRIHHRDAEETQRMRRGFLCGSPRLLCASVVNRLLPCVQLKSVAKRI